jgi:hypothetical protein
MNTRRNSLFLSSFSSSVSRPGNLSFLTVLALLFFASVSIEHAQQVVLGHATDFTSDEYFKPPNQQLVSLRMTGSSATPLPGGGENITDLKIETFDLTGKTQAIIRAPQCTYMMLDGIASSGGSLEIEAQAGQGKMRTTGDGFLWRQSDNSLTISNNVHTVIKMKTFNLTIP